MGRDELTWLGYMVAVPLGLWALGELVDRIARRWERGRERPSPAVTVYGEDGRIVASWPVARRQLRAMPRLLVGGISVAKRDLSIYALAASQGQEPCYTACEVMFGWPVEAGKRTVRL